MSTLLGTLAIYGLIVMITILAQATAKMQKFDLATMAGNREGMAPLTGAAFRLERAQLNSVIALALFAPAVLILHLQGAGGAMPLLLAQIFVLARVVYVIVYALGIAYVRTLAWVVGFLATGGLYLYAL